MRVVEFFYHDATLFVGGVRGARFPIRTGTAPDVLDQPIPRSRFRKIAPHKKGPMAYCLHELIGKGSYGKVYRATSADGKVYAVKQLRLDASQYGKVCILNELRILAVHAAHRAAR